MSTLTKELERLHDLDTALGGNNELAKIIIRLEVLNRTKLIMDPKEVGELTNHHQDVVFSYFSKCGKDVSIPGSSYYADAVRYWRSVRNVSMPEASIAIAELYVTYQTKEVKPQLYIKKETPCQSMPS